MVLTLERRGASLPTLETLKTAVEAEGATVTRSESAEGLTSLRYSRAGAAEGLLAARTLGPAALLLCASTPIAGPEELDAAQSLCAAVKLDAAP